MSIDEKSEHVTTNMQAFENRSGFATAHPAVCVKLAEVVLRTALHVAELPDWQPTGMCVSNRVDYCRTTG